MDVIKSFVSLVILFVLVNLLLVIYNTLNRKWREGMRNCKKIKNKTRRERCKSEDTPKFRLRRGRQMSASERAKMQAHPRVVLCHRHSPAALGGESL